MDICDCVRRIFIWFHVLTVFASLANSSERKLCDIRVWYLNLITDDIFNRDLSPEQLQLKQSIENLVLNAAASPDTRMTDCHVLYMYNGMLKEKFDYSPAGKMTMEEIGEPKPSDEKEQEGPMGTKKEHDEMKEDNSHEANDFDTKSNDNSKEEIGDDKKEQNVNKGIDRQEDSRPTIQIQDGTIETTDDNLSEENITDDTDDEIEEDKEVDETDIDETELDEEEMEDDQLNKKNSAERAELNSEAENRIFDEVVVHDSVLDRYSRSGQIDFQKKKLVGYDKDGKPVFKEVHEDSPGVVKKVSYENSLVKCGLGLLCNTKCYYMLSASYCLLGYDLPTTDTSDHSVKGLDKIYNINEEENNKDHTNPDETKQLVNGKLEKEYSDIENVKSVEEEGTKQYPTVFGFTDEEQQELDSILKNALPDSTMEELKELSDQIQRQNNRETNDNSEQKDSSSEQESTSKQKEKQTEETLSKFETLLHQKTYEYSNKIQTLELMIMKLENRLLSESLNKQNHSSTITRLENLILKLENDLLKMNKNYNTLQDQTESFISKHKQYMELEAASKQTNQLQLPDKTNRNSELITQQQSKIQELFEILKNQSLYITKMKGQYDKLEEQNTLLHQMVMNQTIFMTSIIKTVQDLTEQNVKTRQEMQKIKEDIVSATVKKNKDSSSSIDISILEANIIDKLDAMLNDNGIKTKEVENIAEDAVLAVDEDDASVNLKRYHEYKSLNEVVLNWCPKENFSCPLCIHNTLVRSKCVPFADVSWSPCISPKRDHAKYEDNEEKEETAENAPTVPKVKLDDSGTLLEDNHYEEKGERKEETNVVTSTEDKTGGKDYVVKMEQPDDGVRKGYTSEGKLILKHVDSKSSEKGSAMEDSNNYENAEGNNDESAKQAKTSVKTEPTQIKDSIPTDQHVVPTDHENTNKNSIDKSSQQEDKPNADASNKNSNDKNYENVNNDHDQGKKVNNENNNGNKDSSPDLPKTSSENGTLEVNGKKVPKHLTKEAQKEPRDCYDYYQRGNRRDGLFKIMPVGTQVMIDVYCDMKKGGWTVIQRRQDGSTNFFLTWEEYKKGFGGLYGEHWLGNDNIFFITNQDYYSLRVDLMDWDRNKKYAEFSYFLVENEDEGYRLHVDGYTGDAGDGFTKHNGSKFSTKDVDNDRVVKEFGGSCANRFSGAGWYYKCYASNLNGKYYKGGTIPEKMYDGMTWKPWTGPNYSLKKVEMKIRPASAVD